MGEPQAAFAGELRRLHVTVGSPSYAALAKRSGVPKTTISELFRGQFVKAPAWEKVRALVQACVDESTGDVASRKELAAWWRRRHDELVHALDAQLDAQPATSRAQFPRVDDPSCSRGLLGIAPAIPLRIEAAGLSSELPTYVDRDLDAHLRPWLAAHLATGGFALLVGPAAAGKTRCAYEAVKAVAPNWRIIMPPTRSHVPDLVNGGADLSRSVIWLDNIEKYMGSDGVTAALIRRLLSDATRPVLILGTIWPTTHESFTRPGSRLYQEAADEFRLHEDAREILTVLPTRFDLSVRFTTAEILRAQQIAETDPRLAEALRAGAPEVAEALSAVPELIRRWRHATDPFGAAIITAGVLARRCGHPEPIPPTVLEALAEHCMSSGLRAQATKDWFPTALAWARRAVLSGSASAPLTALASRVGVLSGDNVADALVQHAANDSTAPTNPLIDAPWHVLIEHAEPVACRFIAEIAYLEHNLSEIAIVANRKAAEAGDPVAMFNLAVVLRRTAAPSEADMWLQRAAGADYAPAANTLGVLARDRGDLDEAERCLRQAANAGDSAAMSNLGLLLAANKDYEEAERWQRSAIVAGNLIATFNLGKVLADQNKLEEASKWFRIAAEGGVVPAMVSLAIVCRVRDENDQADLWFRQAAEAGDPLAMVGLGELLFDRSSDEEGEQWLLKAAEVGYAPAMHSYGWRLEEQGAHEQAMQWFRKAAENGFSEAMFKLANHHAHTGNDEQAEHWYRRAAEQGHIGAMTGLAVQLTARGKADQTEHLLRRAAEGGMPLAMSNLAFLLRDRGQLDEAEHWWRKAAEVGDTHAAMALGDIAYQRGNHAKAEYWIRKTAEAGVPDAMHNLSILLRRRGADTEAEDWLRNAAEAGSLAGMRRLASLLLEQNEPAEAEQWLRHAANSGDLAACHDLGLLLAEQGNPQEAEEWLLRSNASPSMVALLVRPLSNKSEEDD